MNHVTIYLIFKFIFVESKDISGDQLQSQHCCSSILLDSNDQDHKITGDRLGFYSQLGQYGARPAYRQEGGPFYLFFDPEKDKWVDSLFFYGAFIFNRLENDNTNYCIDSYSNWYRYNGSDMLFSSDMSVSCATVGQECCSTINIISSNLDLIDDNNIAFYQNNARETIGVYHAIGMVNGRWVYQKTGEDRYLEYGDKYWLGSSGVGKKSGHLHHHGGSVCPENANGVWQISRQEEDGAWSWQDDPQLKVECVHDRLDGRARPGNGPPLALPLIQSASTDLSGATVAFALIALLLSILLSVNIVRNFYKAWSGGAKGTKLITKSLGISE